MHIFKTIKRHIQNRSYFLRPAKWLTDDAIDQLEKATTAAEKGHLGEIRLVIEKSLPSSAIKDSLTTRAQRHFASLGLWNTEARSGVLIYANLAEKTVKIIADTGIGAALTQVNCKALAKETSHAISKGDPLGALLDAIGKIAALLREYYPDTENQSRDELPNRPVIIGG